MRGNLQALPRGLAPPSQGLIKAPVSTAFDQHVRSGRGITALGRPPPQGHSRLAVPLIEQNLRRLVRTVLDTRNALFDVIVHGQDIALPLARKFPVPAEDSRQALRRVWTMGWPFHAERRLGGFALRATDTDWAEGDGPRIAGPALALLLLATGRSACLDLLQGDGVDRLKSSQANR